MAAIGISGLVKRFGAVTAIEALDLNVGAGEFFTLLGPSGCGKTTLLRIIAGFERQNAGDLHVAGRLANDIPAHRRDMGMVFQNYAIFPHMSVFDNVAYGLTQRKFKQREIEAKVSRALELVRLEGYGRRFPDQLSGGQKQRVVLARALVIEPQVLLMDEPLSALDAKVRVGLRRDIRLVQQQLGITTLYVTHDQEEALVVSDRIMVMEAGEIRQLGSPREVYEDPANLFVATFIGTSNLLGGRVDRSAGGSVVLAQGARLDLPDLQAADGTELRLALRPEHLTVLDDGPVAGGLVVLEGVVELVSYLGSQSRIAVRIPGVAEVVEVEAPSAAPASASPPGRAVRLGFRPESAFLFAAANGERVR
ncbi:MAG: ABC transporter ATP-binding protein [Geminicoccaceae bacterium]